MIQPGMIGFGTDTVSACMGDSGKGRDMIQPGMIRFGTDTVSACMGDSGDGILGILKSIRI